MTGEHNVNKYPENWRSTICLDEGTADGVFIGVKS